MVRNTLTLMYRWMDQAFTKLNEKQEESYKKTRRQVDIGMNVNKNKSECNIKVTCLSFKTFQINYHF